MTVSGRKCEVSLQDGNILSCGQSNIYSSLESDRVLHWKQSFPNLTTDNNFRPFLAVSTIFGLTPLGAPNLHVYA